MTKVQQQNCPACGGIRPRRNLLPEDAYCSCSKNRRRLKALIEVYGERCFYCEKEPREFGPTIPSRLVLDHVIPSARSGPNALWNLVPCCARCTGTKNARSIYEFDYAKALKWEAQAALLAASDPTGYPRAVECERRWAGVHEWKRMGGGGA